MFARLMTRLPPQPTQRLTVGLYALVHIVLLALMLVLTLTSAHAQDAVSAVTTIDFGPTLDLLLDVLAPTLIGAGSLLAGWVLKRLANWLGVKIDDSRGVILDRALQRGIGLAIKRVGDSTRQGIPVTLESKAVATVAAYAQRSVPGTLKHFGISSERLGEMIESRLEEVLFDPAVPHDENVLVSRRIVSP